MTTEERIRLIIGELTMQNAALMSKVEEMQKRIAELEKAGDK